MWHRTNVGPAPSPGVSGGQEGSSISGVWCRQRSRALSPPKPWCLCDIQVPSQCRSWTLLLHPLIHTPKACFCSLYTGIQCLRYLQVSHLASSCSFGKAGICHVYCSILAWIDDLDMRLTKFLLGFYCSAVHMLLKSVPTFFVGALGAHASKKGIQPFWNVWILMHKLFRSIQPLLEWLSWQKEEEMLWAKGADGQDLWKCSKYFLSDFWGYTYQRKGLDHSH